MKYESGGRNFVLELCGCLPNDDNYVYAISKPNTFAFNVSKHELERVLYVYQHLSASRDDYCDQHASAHCYCYSNGGIGNARFNRRVANAACALVG